MVNKTATHVKVWIWENKYDSFWSTERETALNYWDSIF